MLGRTGPLVTRGDVAFIIIVAIAVAPPILFVLAQHSGWFAAVLDLLLSVLLGFVVAVAIFVVLRFFYWIVGWPGWKNTSSRRQVVLIVAIALGVIASIAALIRWEMSRECVRWSTRIDVTQSGQVRRTQVCAEFRPLQYGDDPPFDPRSPKGK